MLGRDDFHQGQSALWPLHVKDKDEFVHEASDVSSLHAVTFEF